MSYLLHIDSSSAGAASVSREVAQSFRDAWRGPVVYRDLAAAPVPHITAAGIAVRWADPAERTPEQAAAAVIQDELIEEFLGAGAYLFTVPMYNYSMPSVFKAWLDQIYVVGRTIVPPTAAGRPALVISARGGAYGPDAPKHGMDHLVPALETELGDPEGGLGLDLSILTVDFTHARIVPQFAQFLPVHQASLADSHQQASKLAVTFQAAA